MVLWRYRKALVDEEAFVGVNGRVGADYDCTL